MNYSILIIFLEYLHTTYAFYTVIQSFAFLFQFIGTQKYLFGILLTLKLFTLLQLRKKSWITSSHDAINVYCKVKNPWFIGYRGG